MRTSVRRIPLSLVLLGTAAALLSACGSSAASGSAGSTATSTAAAGDTARTVTATFEAGGDGPAFTYDPARVPVGAQVTVETASADGSTRTTLTVRGLNPNSTYGAHAHVAACGPASGDAAGPHFQFRQDPVKPSVDPAYANASNEIWLDVTTDAQGNGTSTSTVPWTFPADRRAGSVVIHEKATTTEPGKAGTAGMRPGCVTVGF